MHNGDGFSAKPQFIAKMSGLAMVRQSALILNASFYGTIRHVTHDFRIN